MSNQFFVGEILSQSICFLSIIHNTHSFLTHFYWSNKPTTNIYIFISSFKKIYIYIINYNSFQNKILYIINVLTPFVILCCACTMDGHVDTRKRGNLDAKCELWVMITGYLWKLNATLKLHLSLWSDSVILAALLFVTFVCLCPVVQCVFNDLYLLAHVFCLY